MSKTADFSGHTAQQWVMNRRKRTNGGKVYDRSAHLVKATFDGSVITECGCQMTSTDDGIHAVGDGMPDAEYRCKKCPWGTVAEYEPALPPCAHDADWFVYKVHYDGSTTVRNETAHTILNIADGHLITACGEQLRPKSVDDYRSVADDGTPADDIRCTRCSWSDASGGGDGE